MVDETQVHRRGTLSSRMRVTFVILDSYTVFSRVEEQEALEVQS